MVARRQLWNTNELDSTEYGWFYVSCIMILCFMPTRKSRKTTWPVVPGLFYCRLLFGEGATETFPFWKEWMAALFWRYRRGHPYPHPCSCCCCGCNVVVDWCFPQQGCHCGGCYYNTPHPSVVVVAARDAEPPRVRIPNRSPIH